MGTICVVRILMRVKLYSASHMWTFWLITEASTYEELVADVKKYCAERDKILPDNFFLCLAPKGTIGETSEHAAIEEDDDLSRLLQPDDNLVIYDAQEASFAQPEEAPEASFGHDNRFWTADASNDLEIHISGISAKQTRKEVRDYLERFGRIKKLFMPPRDHWDTRKFTFANVTFEDRTTAETLLTKQTSVVYGKEWTYSVAKGKGSGSHRHFQFPSLPHSPYHQNDAPSSPLHHPRSRSRSRERSVKGGDGKKGRYGYQGGKRK